MTLSEGASRSMAVDMSSSACIVNFKVILHRFYLHGGSRLGRSQNGSIPRRARFLGSDCAM